MTKVDTEIGSLVSGQALFQERARFAFPLLVRQAEAGEPITYSHLAEELGMPNPRNLDHPLGSIGRVIEKLSSIWGEKIPPIESLVINRNTDVPGNGVGQFIKEWGDFATLKNPEKRKLVAEAHARVFAYPRWRRVLTELRLKPVDFDFSPEILNAVRLGHGVGASGEGERHRAMKEFVAKHPEVIGLSPTTPTGRNEVPLPSGDLLDVSFDRKKIWAAVEVKTVGSGIGDITRGIFQCVKYRAVMEAVKIAEGKSSEIRVVLALEGSLPPALIPLRNVLGIEVLTSVLFS